MKKLLLIGIILFLVIVVFGCDILTQGGGGSGDDDIILDSDVRILESTPSDGQINAPISPYVSLTFNKSMNWSSLNNDITVRTSISADFFSLVLNTDPNTNTVIISIPNELLSVDSKLLTNETYTVTVSSDVETDAGLTLAQDLVISFTTFEYGTLYDDSIIMSGETWGIVYSPDVDSLYYLGETTGDRVVRRYSLISKLASTELTGVSTQVCYGGLNLWGTTIYINESYDSQVTEYTVNQDGTLSATGTVYQTTGLAAPADTLSEVLDTARIGSDLYFTTGNWHGGASFQDILMMDSLGNWSIAVNGTTFGFANDEDKNLDAINFGGIDYLTLAESVSGKLYKFNTSGGLESSVDLEGSFYTMDLAHDSSGNIYLGTGSGIYKYDGNLNILDERKGLNAGRITVKETSSVTYVYYIAHRNPAVIGYVVF